ncbi:hypothetical protein ACFELO_04010 [Oceanicaulis sp. LC35]|uniref:hypothetical protein n=1 Tax=Oceanicaulis sp. LC35 TaxID=3349635 RepID=UPI003F87AC15
MTGWTSALSPLSRQGLPTLPLLLLLVYAVASSVLGASIRHLESQAQNRIELSYAASTLEKDQASLMRDAQAMVSAPSPLRMQALLLNLEEYEVALNEVIALTRRDSALRTPLGELDQALPAIRRVVLQAASLGANNSPVAVQEEQALALTRLDLQMQVQLLEVETLVAQMPRTRDQIADALRILSWVIHLLAVFMVGALIFAAVQSIRPRSVSSQIAE